MVPITGTLSSNTNKAINEIGDLKKVYNNKGNQEDFNGKSLDILLKYNIIDVDYAEKLINSQKIIVEDGDKLYIQPPVTPIVVHNYNNDDFVPGGERIRRAEEECCCRCCTCTNCCTDEDCQNCLDCIEAFCQALMYILYCLVLVGQCLAAFSGN